MKTFQEFLRWERTTKDAIDFKKIYVDIAGGDPIAGLALSAIMYWHLPDKTGKSKLRVFRDGYWWVARARDDWWEECRLTPKRVDRAISILRDDEKVIQTANFKFGSKGAPTLHIRVLEENFLSAWEGQLGPPIFAEEPQQKPDENEESDEASSDENESKPVEENAPDSEGEVDFNEKGKRELPSVDSDQKSKSNSTEKESASSQKSDNDIPKRSKSLLSTKNTHRSQQSQQQHGASAVDDVDVFDSKESSAPLSPSEGINSENRVLEMPQKSGAKPVKPSPSQKRVREAAQKQFEAGQSTLPQVAAVTQSHRRQAAAPVVEKLIAIGTGADARTIMRYASLHPDHAELVARYFPGTQENTEEYWDEYNEKTGKCSTRASGLIARLQNTQWEPPQLRVERIKEERTMAVRLRHEREQAERENSNRSHDEGFVNRQREYLEIVQRYRALPDDAHHEIRENLWRDAEILRESTIEAEKKGLLKLEDGAPPSSLLDGWTPDHSQFARFALCLRQALHEYSMLHPNEEVEEDFDEEYIEPEPISDAEFVERQVGYLMEERDHNKWETLDELENRRAAHGFDGADADELWAKIRAGVEARVLDRAA